MCNFIHATGKKVDYFSRINSYSEVHFDLSVIFGIVVVVVNIVKTDELFCVNSKINNCIINNISTRRIKKH